MSAWTILRLDTTPPVITWGPVTNAIASEEMTVLYLLDEPRMVEAHLKLADDRTLAFTVADDRITVQIPDDAPEGTGVVTALLQDEVGNVALEALNVHITGTIEPGPPPVPTLPGPPVETPWRTRSRCVTRSRYRILSTRRLPSRATIRTRTRIVRRAALSSPSWVAVRSHDRVRAHVAASSGLHQDERWTVTKRPEGPDEEAAAILLWLL